MTSARTRHYWSRGDKALFCAIALALVGGIGWGLWLNFANRDPVIAIPAESLPRPNAFDYYVAAGRQANVPNGLRVTEYPMAWSTRVDKIVDANRSALAIARQGLNYAYAMPRSAHASSVYDNDYVELVKAFDLQAQADYRRGRWCSGLEDCLDVIQMTQEVAQSGGPLGSDIGLTERYQAIPLALHAVDHLSSAQCRQIIPRLETISHREVPFAEIARQLKVQIDLQLVRNLRDGANGAGLTGGQAERIVDLASLKDSLHADLASRRVALDNFRKAEDDEIQAAHLSYVAYMNRPASVDDLSSFRSALRRTRVARTCSRAELVMFTVALALRAYRLDHGVYPQSLTALVPKYLSTDPIDPFDDQPMRYERIDAKYRLYCIGPDLRDDFGISVPAPQPGSLGEEDVRGDIVLGVNGY